MNSKGTFPKLRIQNRGFASCKNIPDSFVSNRPTTAQPNPQVAPKNTSRVFSATTRIRNLKMNIHVSPQENDGSKWWQLSKSNSRRKDYMTSKMVVKYNGHCI